MYIIHYKYKSGRINMKKVLKDCVVVVLSEILSSWIRLPPKLSWEVGDESKRFSILKFRTCPKHSLVSY